MISNETGLKDILQQNTQHKDSLAMNGTVKRSSINMHRVDVQRNEANDSSTIETQQPIGLSEEDQNRVNGSKAKKQLKQILVRIMEKHQREKDGYDAMDIVVKRETRRPRLNRNRFESYQ